jgi:lysozyme
MIDKEIMENVVMAEDFEGFESLPYHCPAGFLSIGFGRNLEVYPYTKQEAIEWTSKLLLEIRTKIIEDAPWLLDHPVEVRIILTDMAYNLGIKGLYQFARMFKALEDGDFSRAAEELKDSRYFTQTGRRAKAHYETLNNLR